MFLVLTVFGLFCNGLNIVTLQFFKDIFNNVYSKKIENMKHYKFSAFCPLTVAAATATGGGGV